MTHASLFSGIGAPEIAADMLGWTNLFHCEINPFGRQILDYYYPNSVSYEDITKTDFTEWLERVDVLTGGFPCQPFSYAGKRGGAEDDRYLWPHMLRAISECRPTWVVGENVAGITTMVEQCEVVEVGAQATLFGAEDALYERRERFTIERILSDLEGLEYTVQPVLIPACAVGAPHRRDRVFIIAHSANIRQGGTSDPRAESQLSQTLRGQGSSAELHIPTTSAGSGRIIADTDMQRCNQSEFAAESSETQRFDSQAHFNGRDTKPGDASLSEDPMRGGQQADKAQTGAGMGDRIKRPCGDGYATNAESQQECGYGIDGRIGWQEQEQFRGECGGDYQVGARWQRFPTVSPVHRGNDGLPFNVDDLTVPFSKWRTESLKAYGNAIVPQVMYEIFRAMESVENHGCVG